VEILSANWTLYQQALEDVQISAVAYGPRNADSGCAYLSSTILKAASSTVNQISRKRHCHSATPCWDGKC
jgi:hypothetical protein